VSDRLYSSHRADKDVKRIKPNKVILSPVHSAQNLGVIIDKNNLHNNIFISAVSESCFTIFVT